MLGKRRLVFALSTVYAWWNGHSTSFIRVREYQSCPLYFCNQPSIMMIPQLGCQDREVQFGHTKEVAVYLNQEPVSLSSMYNRKAQPWRLSDIPSPSRTSTTPCDSLIPIPDTPKPQPT